MIASTVRGLALVLSLATAVSGPALAGPAPTDGAAQPFRLGAFQLVALKDALNVMDNDGKIFGVETGPAAVAGVLRQAGAPTDKVTLGVDALVVKAPGRVMLFDTGLGPGVHGALPQSLAKAGVSPTEVTDVFITHTHGDHVGGLATADGRLAFANAAIHMSAKEWAWMQANPKSKALAGLIASKVATFEPGETLAPGVTAVALYGHTPGHVGYEIASQGHRLLDMGDTAHSSILSLAKPDWAMGYDNDHAQGETTRRTELSRLAASQEWVFAPHFPFPGVGKIEISGDGFMWKPGLP